MLHPSYGMTMIMTMKKKVEDYTKDRGGRKVEGRKRGV